VFAVGCAVYPELYTHSLFLSVCVYTQDFSAANGMLTRVALLAMAFIGTAAVDQTVLHLAVRFGLASRYRTVMTSASASISVTAVVVTNSASTVSY
jgi:hypothetical protein